MGFFLVRIVSHKSEFVQSANGEGQPSQARAVTTGDASKSGKVAEETFKLFSAHVQSTTGPVLSYLPLSVSRELRDWTVKTTLLYIYRDWSENHNIAPLSPADESDLGSFVALAYHVCSRHDEEPVSLQDFSVYKAVLESLLQDWLLNWNGSTDPTRLL